MILAQKQIQAQQAVVDAQGKADASVVAAKGEADANKLREASISPELIEYIRWQRWDGQLPKVVGNNSTLLGLDSLTATPTPTH
jgi:regulator of protease activity HflC (stomatin/prohibitin superfamily)